MSAANPTPSVSALLTPDSVSVGLPGGTHEAVIDRVIDLLVSHPGVESIDRLRSAIHDRERQMPTAVGVGLALPHARTDAVSDTIAAFATTQEDVLFETPDDVPVRMIFLLAGPRSDTSRHVRILSRISRLMQQPELRSRLIALEDPTAIIPTFEEAELALLAD